MVANNKVWPHQNVYVMQGGKNEFVHLIFCVIQWMSDPICTERKLQYERMSEWIIFVKRLYFFSYIMTRTCTIRWDDDVFRFVLDRHARLVLYSVTSMIQQCVGEYVGLIQGRHHHLLLSITSILLHHNNYLFWSFSLLLYLFEAWWLKYIVLECSNAND